MPWIEIELSMAVHCPWNITREQWGDFLSFSRLQAFDLLEGFVNTCQEG